VALSSVLQNRRAVPVNIEIMRAFVRLRQTLASHVDIARKLDALEKKYDRLRRYPRTDDAAGCPSSPDWLPRRLMRRTGLRAYHTPEWTTLHQQIGTANPDAAADANLKEFGYGE
jgi:hypothetical protein